MPDSFLSGLCGARSRLFPGNPESQFLARLQITPRGDAVPAAKLGDADAVLPADVPEGVSTTYGVEIFFPVTADTLQAAVAAAVETEDAGALGYQQGMDG